MTATADRVSRAGMAAVPDSSRTSRWARSSSGPLLAAGATVAIGASRVADGRIHEQRWSSCSLDWNPERWSRSIGTLGRSCTTSERAPTSIQLGWGRPSTPEVHRDVRSRRSRTSTSRLPGSSCSGGTRGPVRPSTPRDRTGRANGSTSVSPATSSSTEWGRIGPFGREPERCPAATTHPPVVRCGARGSVEA